jgi:hypothetical protein
MITAKVLEDVYSDGRPEVIHKFDADYRRDTGTMIYMGERGVRTYPDYV